MGRKESGLDNRKRNIQTAAKNKTREEKNKSLYDKFNDFKASIGCFRCKRKRCPLDFAHFYAVTKKDKHPRTMIKYHAKATQREDKVEKLRTQLGKGESFFMGT